MKLFDKISNSNMGNEKIGEIDKKIERKKTKKTKEKKGLFTKKESKKEVRNQQPKQKRQVYVPSEPTNPDDDPSKYITTDKVGGRTRNMILKQLGITTEQSTIPSDLITPEAIDAVEFSVSVPSGLSFEEVDQFCKIVEAGISEYRNLINKLNSDVEKLIDELIRSDQQVLEQRNDSMLNTFMESTNGEKEKLENQIINLNSELQKIKGEYEKQSPTLIKLKNEKEELLAQVSQLKASSENTTTNEKQIELQQKLESTINDNKELEHELELLKKQTPKEVKVVDPALQAEVERLRVENERLKKIAEQNAKSEINQPKEVNNEVKPPEKVVSPKATAPKTGVTPVKGFMLSDASDEKEIMERVAQQYAGKKHVKKDLTAKDIELIKESQKVDDIEINNSNSNKKAEVKSDPFSNLMNEMSTK